MFKHAFYIIKHDQIKNVADSCVNSHAFDKT